MAAADDWEPPGTEGVADEPAPAGPTLRRLVALAAVVVVTAATVNLLTGTADPRPTTSTQPTSASTAAAAYPTSTPERLGILVSQPCATPALGGLVLRPEHPGAPAPQGLAQEHRQCDAPGSSAQQAAVIRRTDGSLGRDSAVITWPLPAEQVAVTGLEPTARGDRTELVWPLAGQFARIRGDLPEDELIELARSTRVGTGSLLVSVSADFVTGYLGRHSPDLFHELRYDPPALGPDQSLLFGGPVVAGVQNGVTVEDDMYATGTRQVGQVGRRPLALAFLPGVSVVWQLSGGELAYVQSSRLDATPAVVAALVRLAQRAATLDPVEFDALR